MIWAFVLAYPATWPSTNHARQSSFIVIFSERIQVSVPVCGTEKSWSPLHNFNNLINESWHEKYKFQLEDVSVIQIIPDEVGLSPVDKSSKAWACKIFMITNSAWLSLCISYAGIAPLPHSNSALFHKMQIFPR